MKILQQVYEGKAKIVLATENPDEMVVRYKDSATAFNGEKKGIITNKGIYNLKISEIFFKLLEDHGICTHFIRTLSERDMLVKQLSIVPVEVVVRNIAAGSLAKRLGLEEGVLMSTPIVEFYYKDDALGDPMINHYHIRAMNMASYETVAKMEEASLKINDILTKFLRSRGIILVDFKLEFGLHHGEVLLGDEISPDTCRFWDASTNEKMDKDRFRRDLGKVEEAYIEVLHRIEGGEIHG
jgi:phosphoribosylaminoimidazole-succinocarboxamide synthase